MKVLFFLFCNCFNFSNMKSSFFGSKELVNSSNINTFGSLYKSLARATLCICPLDRIDPLSPIFVFNPEFNSPKKSDTPE